jgi:hypothetical protein
MYCGKTKSNEEYMEWTTVIRQVITENCQSTDDDEMPFDYGIYSSAVTSRT